MTSFGKRDPNSWNLFVCLFIGLFLVCQPVGGLVVSRYAPNRVGGGFDSFHSQLVGYKPRLREQVVVQLRGMHLMIGATLKSEYGQVAVKTQTNN